MLCVHRGEKLALARRYHSPSLTQQQLAEMIDAKRATLARWESNGDVPLKKMPTIASKLNIKETWFYDGNDLPPADKDRIVPPETGHTSGLRRVVSAPMTKLKITGVVGAGPENLDPDAFDPDREIYVPISISGHDHTAMVVSGPSMLPHIQPGDTLIFKDSPTVRLDKVNAIRAEGGVLAKEVTLGQGSLALVSYNEDTPPVPAEGAIALGYLVCLVSADGQLVVGPVPSGIGRRTFEELRARFG